MRSVSATIPPLDHLASGRVLGDLSAEIEETTDFDRLGRRTDRRREFRRSNCGLAHGTRMARLAGMEHMPQETDVCRKSDMRRPK
jgi:hypothetical protein